jgi:hypothetical protein
MRAKRSEREREREREADTRLPSDITQPNTRADNYQSTPHISRPLVYKKNVAQCTRHWLIRRLGLRGHSIVRLEVPSA